MNLLNVPEYQLQVRRSGMGENSGRGVYSTVDIPAGSYLALESAVHCVLYSQDTTKLVYEIGDDSSIDDTVHAIFANSTHRVLRSYAEGYGYTSSQVR